MKVYCNGEVDIQISTSITEPDTVDGISIPAGPLLRAKIHGQGNLLTELALQATHHRSQDIQLLDYRAEYKKDPNTGKVVREFTFKLTPRRMVNKPFVGKFRLGVMNAPELLPEILEHIKTNRHVLVGMTDGKMFILPEDEAKAFVESLGLELNSLTMADLVRIGVFLKRPVGLVTNVPLPEKTPQTEGGNRLMLFENETNDGLILRSPHINRAAAVTAEFDLGGGIKGYQKGIVRPLFHDPITGITEDTACCRELMFHQELNENAKSVTLHHVRLLHKYRASIGLQTLIFGIKDSYGFIERANAELEKTKIEDVISREDALKIKSGLPEALILEKFSPWKMLGSFPIRGVCAEGHFSKLVEPAMVRMCPSTWKRFVKQLPKGAPIPKYVVVNRNPSKPDGSSLQYFILGPVIQFHGQDGGEGLVFREQEPLIAQMEGDVDGDQYTAFVLGKGDDLIATAPTIPTYYNQAPLPKLGDAHIHKLWDSYNAFADKLGSIVLIAQALKFADLKAENEEATHLHLTEELKSVLSALMQTSVQAKKKIIDISKATSELDRVSSLAENLKTPAEAISQLKRQHGHEEKVKFWKTELRDALERFGGPLWRRYQILNELFELWGWLRAGKLEMPKAIKDQALSKLAPEDTLVEKIKGYLAQYRKLKYEHSKQSKAFSDSPNDWQPADPRIAGMEAWFEQQAITNPIVSYALIGYAPPKLAASIVPAEIYKELAVDRNCADFAVTNKDLVRGPIDKQDLFPVTGCIPIWNSIPDDAENLRVFPGKVTAKSCQVHVKWDPPSMPEDLGPEPEYTERDLDFYTDPGFEGLGGATYDIAEYMEDPESYMEDPESYMGDPESYMEYPPPEDNNGEEDIPMILTPPTPPKPPEDHPPGGDMPSNDIIHFVSGSRSITILPKEAMDYLDTVMELGQGIVIGDCYGVDTLVQNYLKGYARVGIFHIGSAPRNNIGDWKANYVAGTSFVDKDVRMTDIANCGLVIWDNKSKGSKANIARLQAQTKPVTVITPPAPATETETPPPIPVPPTPPKKEKEQFMFDPTKGNALKVSNIYRVDPKVYLKQDYITIDRAVIMGRFLTHEPSPETTKNHREWFLSAGLKDPAILKILNYVKTLSDEDNGPVGIAGWYGPGVCHARVVKHVIDHWDKYFPPIPATTTSNIQFISGNVLESKCDAITNPVNCVGAMGKGLALQFKTRFSTLDPIYKDLCRQQILRPGKPYLVQGDPTVVLFPTKDHWKDPSRLEWVEEGLASLRQILENHHIRSIAIPPLGCGLGGLDRSDVFQAIKDTFAGSKIRVDVYTGN